MRCPRPAQGILQNAYRDHFGISEINLLRPSLPRPFWLMIARQEKEPLAQIGRPNPQLRGRWKRSIWHE
jgi:hypothetical protein